MKIGIDGRFLSPPLRGIGNYTYLLLQYLLPNASADHTFVLFIGKNAIIPDHVARRAQIVTYRSASYLYSEQFELPKLADAHGIQVLFCPGNTFPLLLPARIRLVATIHDVMFLMSTSKNGLIPRPTVLKQQLGRIYRRFVLSMGWHRVDTIVTDSRASCNDIVSFFPKAKPRVVHLGIEQSIVGAYTDTMGSEVASLTSRHDRGFFLALAASDPRKNTPRIVRAWMEYAGSSSESLPLVLVGHEIGFWPDLSESIKGRGLEGKVYSFGFVTKHELSKMYSSALALVYPSLYEGFGFPILEAQIAGAAVITSTTSSCGEIAGDAALLVDPTSDEELIEAIRTLAHDSGLCQTLVQKGYARAAQFSWTETARKTMEALIGRSD